MKEIPADFDVQAYGRGCALQQCEMLTRLAEIGMRLAEAAGARALAADIKAELAVRLKEPDVEALLDTASFSTAVIRLCHSLGFDIENDPESYLEEDAGDDDAEASLDSS